MTVKDGGSKIAGGEYLEAILLCVCVSVLNERVLDERGGKWDTNHFNML